MIFVLCDGDLSKAREIGENFSYPDALRWTALGSYRAYMQDKLNKIGRR